MRPRFSPMPTVALRVRSPGTRAGAERQGCARAHLTAAPSLRCRVPVLVRLFVREVRGGTRRSRGCAPSRALSPSRAVACVQEAGPRLRRTSRGCASACVRQEPLACADAHGLRSRSPSRRRRPSPSRSRARSASLIGGRGDRLSGGGILDRRASGLEGGGTPSGSRSGRSHCDLRANALERYRHSSDGSHARSISALQRRACNLAWLNPLPANG